MLGAVWIVSLANFYPAKAQRKKNILQTAERKENVLDVRLRLLGLVRVVSRAIYFPQRRRDAEKRFLKKKVKETKKLSRQGAKAPRKD